MDKNHRDVKVKQPIYLLPGTRTGTAQDGPTAVICAHSLRHRVTFAFGDSVGGFITAIVLGSFFCHDIDIILIQDALQPLLARATVLNGISHLGVSSVCRDSEPFTRSTNGERDEFQLFV